MLVRSEVNTVFVFLTTIEGKSICIVDFLPIINHITILRLYITDYNIYSAMYRLKPLLVYDCIWELARLLTFGAIGYFSPI